MNILITGLNNYLAKNIAVSLAEYDYRVSCLVRDRRYLGKGFGQKHGINIIEGDLLREDFNKSIAEDVSVAFFFSQSPVSDSELHLSMDMLALDRYLAVLQQTDCRHVIYVTKLSDDRTDIIRQYLFRSGFTHTIIRVSNIIGPGSSLMTLLSAFASRQVVLFSSEFENSRCQPVSLSDVCRLLNGIILEPAVYGQIFDIGGNEIMTYREMFERYQDVLKISKRKIRLPFTHAALTSFVYHYFYKIEADLAKALNTNIKNDLICSYKNLTEVFPFQLMCFEDAVRVAMRLSPIRNVLTT